jgi:hypothetical protein
MEPESSLHFGITSRLPSPPTRVAHHDEIGGRRDPLHNAIDLIGSNRGHATTDTDIRWWWPFEVSRILISTVLRALHSATPGGWCSSAAQARWDGRARQDCGALPASSAADIVYSATLGVYGLAALVTSFRPRPNMTAPAARSTQDLYDR